MSGRALLVANSDLATNVTVVSAENLQLTVVWHVDDLKASHVLTKVVTRMANWLKKTYEQLFSDGSGKMKINRGTEQLFVRLL